MGGGVRRHVVKVKRETLVSCMACPLCNKLLKEATTISLCLHTFCRKCIYEKLSDEGTDCCPVCDIELGILPLDKLRPDHNLEDVRSKIFPYKRRKISAPEVMPPAPPPAKRKERSLSSLVVGAPKVPVQPSLTGRRTKATARKRIAAFQGCNFSVEESPRKEASTEDPSASSSPDSSVAKPSSEHRSNEDANDVEMMEGKADLWTPLNCLVEAANRKSSKLNSQGSAVDTAEAHNGPHCYSNVPETKADLESLTVPDGNMSIHKSKSMEHQKNLKVLDEENWTNFITRPVKRRRLRADAQKKAAASNRIMLDAVGSKWNRRNSPIWFSLIACEDQIEHTYLPQIPARYLRIKDGEMPVSFIQKYLVKKLDLTSETEVEIMCRGQPVLPSLQIHNLVDLWSTAKKVSASVGSTAKEFVMVLSYCRKVQAP